MSVPDPFGLAPFAGLDAVAIAFVVFAYWLGFFVRGAFGFGSNMPIVLLTAWVFSPHHTLVLVALTATFAQVHLLPQGLKGADWSVARPLLVGLLAGTALGVWLLTRISPVGLTLVMGLLIAAVVAMDLTRAVDRLAQAVDLRGRAVNFSLAATGGVMGNLSGGGGIYFLAPYLKWACRSPEDLRATNLVVAGLFMLQRIVFLLPTGLISWTLFAESLLLLPAVFAGTWSGGRLARSVPPQRFYRALQVFLAVAALATIARGIAELL